MSTEYQKRTRKLIKILEQQGWTQAHRHQQDHVIVRPPTGDQVVLSASPSDWRTWKNQLARLRRHGAVIPR